MIFKRRKRSFGYFQSCFGSFFGSFFFFCVCVCVFQTVFRVKLIFFRGSFVPQACRPKKNHYRGNFSRCNPRGFATGWFPGGWFWRMFPGAGNWDGGAFGCSPVPKTGTTVHADAPQHQKPERGYIRQNRPFT